MLFDLTLVVILLRDGSSKRYLAKLNKKLRFKDFIIGIVKCSTCHKSLIAVAVVTTIIEMHSIDESRLIGVQNCTCPRWYFAENAKTSFFSYQTPRLHSVASVSRRFSKL